MLDAEKEGISEAAAEVKACLVVNAKCILRVSRESFVSFVSSCCVALSSPSTQFIRESSIMTGLKRGRQLLIYNNADYFCCVA